MVEPETGVMAAMQETLEAVRGAVQAAEVDRAKIHASLAEVIRHQKTQNGWITRSDARMSKIESDIHEEALLLARADAARQAGGELRRRDLAYATFGIGALAAVGPWIVQGLVGG